MDTKDTKILSAWNEMINKKSVWQNILIKDHSFFYSHYNKKIFLSSFQNKDLPNSPYELTFLGKVLTNISTFANLMSRKPGTEEITFYCLINKTQGNFFSKTIDRKLLNIVAPPINWRRFEIESSIKELLLKYITVYKEPFLFMDIGCGGGFDSLEIERLLLGMNRILKEDILPKYDIINIDIDSKWLKNNEALSEIIFKGNSKIKRFNMSIFEYLDKKIYINHCKDYDNIIISCNGFAEFLRDDELKNLYKGIYNICLTFKGKVNIILPFANKNKKQEDLGNKIGFKFRAKEKDYMLNLVKDIFVGFNISHKEKYSQIVLSIWR